MKRMLCYWTAHPLMTPSRSRPAALVARFGRETAQDLIVPIAADR